MGIEKAGVRGSGGGEVSKGEGFMEGGEEGIGIGRFRQAFLQSLLVMQPNLVFESFICP